MNTPLATQPLITAAITADNAADIPSLATATHQGTLAWSLGQLRWAPKVCVATEGEWLCLSRGAPRFPARGDVADDASAWLGLFKEHGLSSPEKIEGRFAVAVINLRTGETLLANDRFAIDNWAWSIEAGRLRFSDRANAIKDGHSIAPQAIYSYLYFHVIPSPLTVFDGIQRLAPGHLLHFRDGKVETRAYWRARFDEPSRVDVPSNAKAFLDIIEAAVRTEVKGTNAGAFLSGGTDSSTVSGMLCKVLGKPAKTYSIGFDAAGYDEMEYARLAARHFGADHREYYVTPNDLLDGIAHVAQHYDQPFGNSSAVPAWICATRAREDGVDKLLAGDGGDELFGGNTRYAKQRVFSWYHNLPGLLRQGVVEPVSKLPALGNIPLIKKGVSYVEQARVPMPDRLQMYNMLQRLGHDTLFTPDFLARIDPQGPIELQRDTWSHSTGSAFINRMLAFDFKHTLADNDLPKVTGTTQLAGVDVGFPLLNDRLLALSCRLPAAYKLKGLKLRWFFKEALKGFLPNEILTKKKHGFGLPFGVWAVQHDALGALAGDALERFATRGVVRPEFIDQLRHHWLPAYPGYYGEMVWILMMLEFWLETHAPEWSLE